MLLRASQRQEIVRVGGVLFKRYPNPAENRVQCTPCQSACSNQMGMRPLLFLVSRPRRLPPSCVYADVPLVFRLANNFKKSVDLVEYRVGSSGPYKGT